MTHITALPDPIIISNILSLLDNKSILEFSATNRRFKKMRPELIRQFGIHNSLISQSELPTSVIILKQYNRQKNPFKVVVASSANTKDNMKHFLAQLGAAFFQYASLEIDSTSESQHFSLQPFDFYAKGYRDMVRGTSLILMFGDPQDRDYQAKLSALRQAAIKYLDEPRESNEPDQHDHFCLGDNVNHDRVPAYNLTYNINGATLSPLQVVNAPQGDNTLFNSKKIASHLIQTSMRFFAPPPSATATVTEDANANPNPTSMTRFSTCTHQ